MGGVHIGTRALHVLNLIWLGYIARLSQWGEGVISSFQWFLPVFATRRGGGRESAPCGPCRILKPCCTVYCVQPSVFQYFFNIMTSVWHTAHSWTINPLPLPPLLIFRLAITRAGWTKVSPRHSSSLLYFSLFLPFTDSKEEKAR